MTLTELREELNSLDIPIAYFAFKRDYEPDLPFIIYYKLNEDTFQADDTNFICYSDVVIELYTELKDEKLEKKLEKLLNKRNLIYRKTETYWEDEFLYEVLYETRIF